MSAAGEFKAVAATDGTRRVPSWLASVVIHLIVLSLCVSISAPSLGPPPARGPLLLEANYSGSPVSMAPVAVIQSASEMAQRLDPQQAQGSAPPIPLNQAPSMPSPSDAPAAAPAPTPRSEAVLVVAEAADAFTDALRKSPHVAHWAPTRVTSGKRPGQNWPTPAQLKDSNEVVDRFIQYDVGQLNGAEGQQALNAFRMLGAESVPSLVRGLNRAASIQYTCPVGVLSAKLVQVILQSKDNALTEYVIQHLGEDVPASAPHERRLEQLRRFIAERANQAPQPLRDELQRRRVPANREMIQAVEEMTVISVDPLVDAIRSINPAARTAAILGVIHRAESLPLEERLQVAGVLVAQLARNDEIALDLVHEALVKLANGLDFGNQPRDAEQWLDYWRGMQQSERGAMPDANPSTSVDSSLPASPISQDVPPSSG